MIPVQKVHNLFAFLLFMWQFYFCSTAIVAHVLLFRKLHRFKTLLIPYFPAFIIHGFMFSFRLLLKLRTRSPGTVVPPPTLTIGWLRPARS